MGRHKRGYNSEARTVISGQFTDSNEVKKLQTKVEIKGLKQEQIRDDSNALVLPSKKRQFKKAKESAPQGKILSKKKRKILEKIVEQKKKKSERSQLLEKLQQVQTDPSMLDKMTSISQVQTKGLKRQLAENEWQESEQVTLQEAIELTRNPSKKKKLVKLLPRAETRTDVVGFDESSESESSSEEEEATENDEADQELSEADEDAQEEAVTEEASKPTRRSTSPDQRDVVSAPALRAPDGSTRYVPVSRSEAIQASRERLPIIKEEQAIMEAINENPVVILAGETGSGKTTQLPQFLYESGYTRDGQLIGITEPRRVAAMAMARRVGEELNLPQKVGYQIRFEGNVTPDTEIKFMTDGVLLRELSKDFYLRKYSVIVIDEAHERSVFTDILIGMLSRSIKLRQKNESKFGPLRLVIMSATLRVSDFTQNSQLFKTTPPCITVESRQFEVTCHFQKQTPDDYVTAALKKTCKIHKELPSGGILVFVTGQQEVNVMVKKLRKLFPLRSAKASKTSDDEEESLETTMKESRRETKKRKNKTKNPKQAPDCDTVDLQKYNDVPLDDTEADVDRDVDEISDDEDNLDLDEFSEFTKASQPLWVLPLYSLLRSEKQNKIFEPVPANHRLCVVATNIAETSLTIPGIKYVVDTGKVKAKMYDRLTGVTSYHVTWCSKASANQRAGRAGRQGPGHCYRLFSSEVFKNSFAEHSEPEIVKKPVDDLVLQMKSMQILKVDRFPFPTPPKPEQIEVAEKKLILLGALKEVEEVNAQSQKRIKLSMITDLGKSMAAFPVAPNFAKMLALSEQHGLVAYTIALVAVLTVQEVLMETPIGGVGTCFTKEEIKKVRKIWAGKGHGLLLGDPMILIKAVCASEAETGVMSLEEYCNRYALRYKAMMEIRKLRRQLTNEINLIIPSLNLALNPQLTAPDDSQALLLRQILLSGMASNVAKKVGQDPESKRAVYKTGSLKDDVYLHANSIFNLSPKFAKNPPEWVVFQEVFETGKGLFMRGITAIEPEWLPRFARASCNFMPPSPDPEPWFAGGRVMCQMDGTFGPQAWPLPTTDQPYPDNGDGKVIRYFARLFLEGQVVSGVNQFKECLLCIPSSLTKTYEKHSQAVKDLIQCLGDKSVSSLESLREELKLNPEFLKPEFQRLVPKSRKSDVDQLWHQIVANLCV